MEAAPGKMFLFYERETGANVEDELWLGTGEWGEVGGFCCHCHRGKELHRGTVGLRPDRSRGLSSSTTQLVDLSATERKQTGASGQLVINITNELAESSSRPAFPFWLPFSRAPSGERVATTLRSHPPAVPAAERDPGTAMASAHASPRARGIFCLCC